MGQSLGFDGERNAPGGQRCRLVADVGACLSEWERALVRGALAQSDQAGLRRQSAELAQRSRGVGFGGIGHHLGELVRVAEASSHDVRAVQAQLHVVREITGEARKALTPQEQAWLDRAPELGAANPAPPGIVAPPPLIVDTRRSEQNSAPAPPPPLLAAAPLPAPLGAAAPAPPPLGAAAPLPAPLRQNNPGQNFLVRSLLSLRPGRGAGAAAGVPPVAGGPDGGSLLGLGRRSSPSISTGSGAPAPPQMLSSDSGLPPVAGELRRASTPPKRAADSGMMQLLNRVSQQQPVRRSPSGKHERVPSGNFGRAPSGPVRRREEGSGGWWLGVVAAFGVVALAGIAVAAVVIGRRDDETTPSASAVASALPSGAVPTASVLGGVPALPREKLGSDDERFRSLLMQLHGRGKESPELRAFVDEQAAVAARTLRPDGCAGTRAECEAWAGARELLVGAPKKVVKRRQRAATDRMRPRWLVGLAMPDIPVEDDPRVQRRFEFYTENPVGRETFQQMLFRCGAYRDLIQATLIRHALPADLLAVTFAESGCSPLAKSPMGAEGLWQFIPAAARAYHLRIIDGVVDERHSPTKSTEAAVRYLSDLHQKLGQWDLVFASYNMGPFGLMARVERAGGNVTFWDLVDSDLLPDETADYAPAIQAIALILRNLQKLKFAGIQMRAPLITGDLEVPPGTRLGLIARAAATSIAQVRSLNLDIKGDRTPTVPNFAVQVPKEVTWQARDTLKELLAAGDNADLCVPASFDWGRQRFTPEMAASCARQLGSGAITTGTADPRATPPSPGAEPPR